MKKLLAIIIIFAAAFTLQPVSAVYNHVSNEFEDYMFTETVVGQNTIVTVTFQLGTSTSKELYFDLTNYTEISYIDIYSEVVGEEVLFNGWNTLTIPDHVDYILFEFNVPTYNLTNFYGKVFLGEAQVSIPPFEDPVYPIFDSPGVYFIDYDNMVPLSTITNELYVYDDADGDITENIYIIEDNYSLASSPGEYSITYGVTDSDNNTATVTIIAKVVDISGPVISGIQDLTLQINSDPLDLLDGVTAIDNVDGDLTANLVMAESVNYSVPGTYQVTYTVEDSLGNITEESILIDIVDTEGPVFTGPDAMYKASTTLLSVSQILEYYSAADIISGAAEIELISDGYTGHGNVNGVYTITLQAEDDLGNITSKTIEIHVLSYPINFLFTSDMVLVVDTTSVLTTEDMIAILQKCGSLPNENLSAVVANDTYVSNEALAGEYTVTLNTTTLSGIETNVTFDIHVIEDLEDIQVDDQLEWDDRLWNLVKENPGYAIGGAIAVLAFIVFLLFKK